MCKLKADNAISQLGGKKVDVSIVIKYLCVITFWICNAHGFYAIFICRTAVDVIVNNIQLWIQFAWFLWEPISFPFTN